MPPLPPSETRPRHTHRKRKGEGRERREEILTVAKRLFIEDGYEKTTIRRVAAELGLSSTALYVYFPDKHAILNEICAQTFNQLTRECDAIRNSEGHPVRRLEQAVTSYIRFGLEHPHEYLLTFNMPDEDAPAHQDMAEGDDPGWHAFRSFQLLVADVIEERGKGNIDPNGVTQCLWASVHGLVCLLLVKPCFPWIDRDRLIRTHVALLLGGILNPSSAD